VRSRKSYSLNPILTDRCPTPGPKTEDSISDLPVPPDTLLSSVHGMETCESSDGALKDISSPHSPGERNEKGGKRDGHNENERMDETDCVDGSVTVTETTGVRDSPKRIADCAGLYESDKRAHRLKKIRCADKCAGLYCRGRV